MQSLHILSLAVKYACVRSVTLLAGTLACMSLALPENAKAATARRGPARETGAVDSISAVLQEVALMKSLIFLPGDGLLCFDTHPVDLAAAAALDGEFPLCVSFRRWSICLLDINSGPQIYLLLFFFLGPPKVNCNRGKGNSVTRATADRLAI